MKKMKFFLAAALICGAAFAGYAAYERATMTEQERAILANLEALEDPENDRRTIYIRRTGSCEVYVGVKGELRLLGGAVLKAGADGYVRIDGIVTCASGGTEMCRSVECIDLYKSILST